MDRMSIFFVSAATFGLLILAVFLVVRFVELVRWLYSQRPSVLERDNFESLYPMMRAGGD